MAAAITIARTLSEAFTLRATASRLLLPSSADLRCVTIMCENLGHGCACRLSLSLERMPLLTHVDVSENGLPVLPDSLFSSLPALREVRAGGNALTALPASLRGAAALEVLDLRGNKLEALPLAALEGLPALRELHVAGNPLAPQAAAALRASPLARLLVEDA